MNDNKKAENDNAIYAACASDDVDALKSLCAIESLELLDSFTRDAMPPLRVAAKNASLNVLDYIFQHCTQHEDVVQRAACYFGAATDKHDCVVFEHFVSSIRTYCAKVNPVANLLGYALKAECASCCDLVWQRFDVVSSDDKFGLYSLRTSTFVHACSYGPHDLALFVLLRMCATQNGELSGFGQHMLERLIRLDRIEIVRVLFEAHTEPWRTYFHGRDDGDHVRTVPTNGLTFEEYVNPDLQSVARRNIRNDGKMVPLAMTFDVIRISAKHGALKTLRYFLDLGYFDFDYEDGARLSAAEAVIKETSHTSLSVLHLLSRHDGWNRSSQTSQSVSLVMFTLKSYSEFAHASRTEMADVLRFVIQNCQSQINIIENRHSPLIRSCVEFQPFVVRQLMYSPCCNVRLSEVYPIHKPMTALDFATDALVTNHHSKFTIWDKIFLPKLADHVQCARELYFLTKWGVPLEFLMGLMKPTPQACKDQRITHDTPLARAGRHRLLDLNVIRIIGAYT